MQKQHHVLRPHPVRRGTLCGALVLTGVLIAGACSSSGDSATPATNPDTTASGSDETPPATNPEPATTPTPAPPVVTPTTATPPTTIADEEPVASPGSNINNAFAELEARGFAGTVMIQSPDGEWSAGFGLADRAANIDNDINTVFDIGSISKQFTAAAILHLEMDGLLSVDDPIGDYISGLRPEQAAVTLHQLLTHTGAMPLVLGPDDEAIDLDSYIARLAVDQSDVAPIGEYRYSNVGYSLLGAVIETVTGDAYEVYLQDALFEPAGMTQTGYVLPDWTDSTIAVGYDGSSVFGRPNEQPWDVDGPWWNLRANGGLLSTMPDLLRWDAALYGDEILNAEAKNKLFTPHVPMDDGVAFHGYGWVVVPLPDGTRLIQHAGGNDIFFADFWRFVDEDTTVVLASNVADPAAFDLGEELAVEVLDPERLDELE